MIVSAALLAACNGSPTGPGADKSFNTKVTMGGYDIPSGDGQVATGTTGTQLQNQYTGGSPAALGMMGGLGGMGLGGPIGADPFSSLFGGYGGMGGLGGFGGGTSGFGGTPTGQLGTIGGTPTGQLGTIGGTSGLGMGPSGNLLGY
jgi:hypothetical protein